MILYNVFRIIKNLIVEIVMALKITQSKRKQYNDERIIRSCCEKHVKSENTCKIQQKYAGESPAKFFDFLYEWYDSVGFPTIELAERWIQKELRSKPDPASNKIDYRIVDIKTNRVIKVYDANKIVGRLLRSVNSSRDQK